MYTHLDTHLYMYPRLEKANTEYASINRIFVVVSESKKLRIRIINFWNNKHKFLSENNLYQNVINKKG